MYRLVGIYLLMIYILPIFILAIFQLVPFYSSIFLILIISFFYLPRLLLNNLNTITSKNNIDIHINYLLLIFIAYLFFRYQYIYEILKSVYDGSYFDFALSLAIDRYSGNWDNSINTKIAITLFIAYFTSLGICKKKNYFYYIIGLFLIAIESSSLARSGALLALAAYFSEIIFSISDKLKNKNIVIIFIKFFPLISFILFLYIFSSYNRLEDSEIDKWGIVIDKTLAYTFGMHAALCEWFYESFPIISSDYGFNTLGAFYKIFGYDYPDGHYYPISTSIAETNVFTIVRDLAQDFTIIGVTLYFFITGILLRFYDLNYFRTYYLIRYLIYPIFYLIVFPYNYVSVLIGFTTPLLFIKFKISVYK